EKEQKIDSGSLDTPEGRACDGRDCIRECRANSEQPRQVVLDSRFVVWILTELAAEARDKAGCDLLADRDFRAGAGFAGRLDPQGFEAERALHSRHKWRGDEARRERTGSHGELL